MRQGGFRAVVFLSHGLVLAFFTSLAVLCAFILIRTRIKLFRTDPRFIAVYLTGLLALCKSLGPLLYAIIFAPVILFTRPRTWVKLACAVSLVLCAYPFLRMHGLAPTDTISNIATSISADRDASLQTRLENEDMLLGKAEQKPWFGWGGWSRNRVFDEWGKDISLTDGTWIIYFGVYGWLGYLSLFGLLAMALFQAERAIGRDLSPPNVTLGGLALLLMVSLINCIPNSVEEWFLFLLAGSVGSGSRSRVKAGKPSRLGQSEPTVPAMARPA
jgi:hypothetical protein